MRHSRWSIAVSIVLLFASTGWAQNGKGLFHFEGDPADMHITTVVVDPVGAVRDNPTGPVALFCAGVQSEDTPLVATDTGEAGIDRFRSREEEDPAVGPGSEPHSVARFLGATPRRRTDVGSDVAASHVAPNFLTFVW